MAEFGEIYEAYFHDVFLYIKGLSKNESVAEEIASETFFKAMRSIDSFRGDCDIRVWLCQIAKNGFFSYMRKHPAFVGLEEAESAGLLEAESSSQGRIEELLCSQSDAMQIHMALHGLGEPYKEVFSLRIFGELSFRQIGLIFGKTENWACVTYHRARNKIIKKMEDSENGK